MYRPPGQLGDFLEELDVLLSNFPEDGTPLVLLGDFNIHLEKPPGYWLQHSSHFIWPQTSVYYGYSQIR